MIRFHIPLAAICMLPLFAMTAPSIAGALPSRDTVDLSGTGWTLWRDSAAKWQNDKLFLPGASVAKLPTNPPTAGWDVLESPKAIPVSVPGTAVEYLGKGTGQASQIEGVTWWTRKIKIPTDAAGRKVLLEFNSVRLRAEVYVNHKLVAYDIVGNTPFTADITSDVKPGTVAELAVRITNPGGNFSWEDYTPFHWGKYTIPMSHGFGGITGNVWMIVCDPVYIEDVYAQNQPTITAVKIITTIKNTAPNPVRRDVVATVMPADTQKTAGAYHADASNVLLKPGDNIVALNINAPDAKIWSLQSPHLYVANVRISGDGSADALKQTFGFRWFTPTGIGTNAMLRLNGHRIVLRTAISWGFWPINGIFATPAMAEKQIHAAKTFGLNMLNFHRCIGSPVVLNKADEMGLLYFEEPGGYVSAGTDSFAQALSRIKLMRMIKRDRSHPSLIIYNMINEQWNQYMKGQPNLPEVHRHDLQAAHALDPSRIMLYTSAWANVANPMAKMHMLPFDNTVYYRGWSDNHRATGPYTWKQSFYRSPTNHYNLTRDKTEVVYWGEEGAISTPPRLQLIEAELAKAGHLGWDGQFYLNWDKQFNQFITDKGFRKAFPTVDDLCKAMGAVSLEHQGRKIEDLRICDLNDGYAINGWEAEVNNNHSGIVDEFRNSKGDPDLIARYNKPLYVAVKVRQQIVESHEPVTVDFYTIDETNLKGPHTLAVTATDPNHQVVFTKKFAVNLKGGDVFSQLVAEGVVIPTSRPPGNYTISAKLLDLAGIEQASGQDSILSVDWQSAKLDSKGAIYETGSRIKDFLHTQKGLSVPAYTRALPPLDWIIIARSPLPMPVVIPTDDLTSSNGSKPGLTGTFYSGTNFEKKIFTRQDKTIDFTWSKGSTPDPNVPLTSDYSARWEGELKAPVTGKYQIHVSADDGVRLWVNGKQLINLWHVSPKNAGSVTVSLIANKPVPIKLEYFQAAGGADVHLQWQPPSHQIDSTALFNRAKQDGTTLLFIDQPQTWKDDLTKQAGINITGSFTLGGDWLGGQYFVRENPLFKGLPVDGALNWPYQAVVDGRRIALHVDGGMCICGAYETWPFNLGTAVAVFPCGKGRIILSTLNIAAKLNDRESSAAVARKLLCNYLQYAGKGSR